MDKQELYELHKELQSAQDMLQWCMMRFKHGSSSESSIEGYEEAFKDGLTVAYEELDDSGLLEDLDALLKKVSNAMNRRDYEYIPPSPGQLELWKLEDEQGSQ